MKVNVLKIQKMLKKMASESIVASTGKDLLLAESYVYKGQGAKLYGLDIQKPGAEFFCKYCDTPIGSPNGFVVKRFEQGKKPSFKEFGPYTDEEGYNACYTAARAWFDELTGPVRQKYERDHPIHDFSGNTYGW